MMGEYSRADVLKFVVEIVSNIASLCKLGRLMIETRFVPLGGTLGDIILGIIFIDLPILVGGSLIGRV